MDARTAREGFSAVLTRAAVGKERVVVSRRGKPVAALVPIEDLRALEDMEDALDAAASREVMAEFRASGSKGIPLEQWERRLGLK